MNILAKIIKADAARKSRFHDMAGNRVGMREIRHLPQVLFHWSQAKFGRYPMLPWIPAQMTKLMESRISPNSFILEIGAGMSTLWWAMRVRKVVAVEENEGWIAKLEARAATLKLGNLEIWKGCESDERLMSIMKVADLVVVDSDRRDVYVRMGLESMKPESYLYLDNSDRCTINRDEAEAVHMINSSKRVAERHFITGFAPGQLAPSQGLLAKLNNEKF